MPAPPLSHRPGRRGLVALGDSVTVGEGQSMLGLRCQSWAQWLAAALELPYTGLARNGARAADLPEQLGRLRGPYELCCLYIGVNDARAVDFDAAEFATALDAAAAVCARECDELLMASLPVDLGRPRAGVSVLEANRVVLEVAARHGATVAAFDGLRGWRLVLPDAVHLTALGQLGAAELAAGALAAGGAFDVARALSSLAEPARGWRPQLRYAFTGHAPAFARDLRRRAREGTLLAG